MSHATLITGMPRSGSTWLAGLLAQEFDQQLLYEPFRANPALALHYRAWPFEGRWTYLDPSRPAPAFQRAVESLVGNRMALYGLARIRGRDDATRFLRHSGRRQIDRLRGQTPLIKDTGAGFLAPWLDRQLGIRAIYLVRHPAGVAAGFKRLGWTFRPQHLLAQPDLMAGPLAGLAHELKSARDTIDPIAAACLVTRVAFRALALAKEEIDDLTVIRYEDVALDPANNLPLVACAMGRSLTQARAVDLTSNDHAPPATNMQRSDGQHVLNRDPRQVAYSWQARLSQAEKDRVRQLMHGEADAWYPDT